MIPTSLPVALLVLLSCTVACGEQPKEEPASQGQNPCALITEAEAEAILGADLMVKPGAGAGPSTCLYEQTGRRLNGFTLTVFWKDGRTALDVAKQGQKLATGMIQGEGRSLTNMLELEKVDGLGDEAWFNPGTGSLVLKGDVLLEFDIRAMMWHQKYEPGKELWKQLVNRALSRLPAR